MGFDSFKEFDPVILAVFLVYVAVLIGIAVIRVRPLREMSDYVLGGRRISSFTSALSASSSATTGWTMLVFPALAFSQGAVQLWTMLSILLGVWLAWTVLGKRLRRYTIAEDSLTLPEFYEKRFGDSTGILRGLSAIATIFFIMFYVNSGLIAGSKLLDTVFGLDHTLGVLITLAALVSYTFLGGFLAVSRTDVFQAMLMLIGFVILPLTLIALTEEPFSSVGQAEGFLNPMTAAGGNTINLVFFLGAAGWGLGYFGSHRVLQRFMAVESEEKVTSSRNISAVWITLIFSFGFLLGLVARPALMEIGMLGAVPEPERVYFVIAEVFFIPVITGLLLTAVVAAVMSTADSQLLLGSAIAADDLPLIKRLAYRVRYRYALGAFGRVWLGRLLLIIIGVVSAYLAINAPDSIFNLVAFAWGGMGAAFGPVTILALYWRRFNFYGAVAAIVTGAAVVSVWQFNSGGPGGVLDIGIATAPGFIIATTVAIAVTLLTPKPSERVPESFDRVNAPVQVPDAVQTGGA